MADQYSHKQREYKWKGLTLDGRRKSGLLIARHRTDAIIKLNKQKIRITTIRECTISRRFTLSSQIKAKEITIFTRQISTLLSSGLPILQSLKLISSNQSNPYFQLVLLNIIHDIESGLPLYQSIQTSNYFDDSYISLVASGELTGQIDKVFDRLAHLREKKQKIHSKVIKAMIYPSLVLLTALLVFLLMLTMVIPEFEQLFSGLGAELPWFTQQTVRLSHGLKNYAIHITLVSVLIGLIVTTITKHSLPLQLTISRWRLITPILGHINTSAVLATFCHVLAENLASGVPILKGLKTSSKTTNNLYYQHVFDSIHHHISSGIPLHIAIKQSNAFPDYFTQMIMIGEESGSLDTVLKRIATYYENEVDNLVDNLGKALEPLIIIILGLLVGGLVISMYLPIFNLMSVMG